MPTYRVIGSEQGIDSTGNDFSSARLVRIVSTAAAGTARNIIVTDASDVQIGNMKIRGLSEIEIEKDYTHKIKSDDSNNDVFGTAIAFL
tara:strand:- start:532 stop:798 length:267 start_codon:yes stop_codon:yes gene_type:complete